MRLVFIIRKDTDIFIIKNASTLKYEFPYIDCEDVESGIEDFRIFLSDMGLQVVIGECDAIAPNIQVYRCDIFSYIHGKSDEYFESIEQIINADVEEWCASNLKSVFCKLQKEVEITKELYTAIKKLEIEDIALNISIQEMGLLVFIRQQVENAYLYNPFAFKVEYDFDGDDVRVFVSWRLIRSYAPGDKSDIYVLFGSTMAILIAFLLNKDIIIEYESLFNDCEISSGGILFTDFKRFGETEKVKEYVEKAFGDLLFLSMMHGSVFGSYSHEMESYTEDSYYILPDVVADNFIARKEHAFYYSIDAEMFLIELLHNQKDVYHFFDNLYFEFLDGVDGKILYNKNASGEAFHFIPDDKYQIVKQVLSFTNNDSNTKIIGTENQIYIWIEKRIYIISGDFRRIWVDVEKEKILERQRRENQIFSFNRSFKWKYPIKAARFEELIADLMEMEPYVFRVRLMGKTNEADGGRDILITKRRNLSSDDKYLVIGQCKAYQNSVGKSQVTDIRDMLDYYDANGFFLAASSSIRVSLIDHLQKLEQRYDVDWWTEREIFNRIRKNYYLVDRYSDIIEIDE